jgi:NADPH2:quinone reductase
MEVVMHAIVVSEFGDSSVLRYQSAPDPQARAGQVVVRLFAAGVNPVDTYIRGGHYALGEPELPYIPGNDGAGMVEALGDGVERLSVGDRVFVAGVAARQCSGTYAEKVSCDASAVQALPHELSFAQGASLGTPGMAAYHALLVRGKLRAGERILIQGGSGGVGTLAIQIARLIGAEVFATAGSEDGRKLAASLGAEHVFDYHDDALAEKLMKASAGHGVDLIIEVLADKNLEHDMSLLAKGGRVIIVGSRGSLTFSPRLAMTKEADIRGMTIGNSTKEELARELRGLAALLRGITPVVGQEFPLADAARAQDEVIQKSASHGKMILRIATV